MVKRWHRAILSGAAFLVLTLPAGAQCRLAPALGMDISSSVDAAEYELQLHGLAAAFRDPAVIAAALSDPVRPPRTRTR